MFDQGKHYVLHRDGVAIIIKAPENELPQVVYWGNDISTHIRDSVTWGTYPEDKSETRCETLFAHNAQLESKVPSDSNAVSGLNALQGLHVLDAITSRQTPPATLDTTWHPSVMPTSQEGWLGKPALRASIVQDSQGMLVHKPIWMHPSHIAIEQESEYGIRIAIEDAYAQCELRIQLAIASGGVVTMQATISNIAESKESTSIQVDWLETVLPVSKQYTHMLTFAGRWPHEKTPSVTAIPEGSTTRASYQGKPGHDSAWATVLSVGEPRNRSGEIVACHIAYSGDIAYTINHMSAHPLVFGGGEALGAGEIVLQAGESYTTPQACFVWTDQGLDGIGQRFHTFVRSMQGHGAIGTKPRPFTLNTWEAVYFDHNEQTLTELADKAAAIGVERFVIDDGWFHLRRDDSRGLGDWYVDHQVWPHGLDQIARHVHDLGMEFGLWFEPEMMNPDSDLYRCHPDWLLAAQPNHRQDISYRHQYVLDLARPEAWEYIRSAMDTLIHTLDIDYIKWDHNRYLTEPEHNGRYGVHAQTEAAYRLIQRLKHDHPGIEIESCSSGGGRTDLGIIRYTDRVWASDSNDPHDRVDIQRWTELLLPPPEYIGAHIGPSPAHATGRATDLAYRAAVSLMGCSGFEWNILECDARETAQLQQFVTLYKEMRYLLHHGRVSHADVIDPSLMVRGVTSEDNRQALWIVVAQDVLKDSTPEMLRITDLDPQKLYTIRLRTDVGVPKWGWTTPQWLTYAQQKNGFVVSGQLLYTVGLQLPTLWPQQALIIQITQCNQ